MDKFFYAVGIVLIVVGGVYWGYTSYQNKLRNDALLALYTNLSAVTSYVQQVETTVSVSGRRMTVAGVYKNDREQNVYFSDSTTTLAVPDEDPYSFSIKNRYSDRTINLRIERLNGALTSPVPMDGVWHTFPESEVPETYRSVAVAGPILDYLALFDNKGSSLLLKKSVADDSTFGTPLPRFVYTLAPKLHEERPPMAAIRDRLLGEGTVSVWTNESMTAVRYLVLTAPAYTSTTTIESVNIPFYARGDDPRSGL